MTVSGNDLTRTLGNGKIAETQSVKDVGDGTVAVLTSTASPLLQHKSLQALQYKERFTAWLKRNKNNPSIPLRRKNRPSANNPGRKPTNAAPKSATPKFNIPNTFLGLFALSLRIDQAMKTGTLNLNPRAMREYSRIRQIRPKDHYRILKPNGNIAPVPTKETELLHNQDARNDTLAGMTDGNKLTLSVKKAESTAPVLVINQRTPRARGPQYYKKLNEALEQLKSGPTVPDNYARRKVNKRELVYG
ncbi:MAG TPA: hypothetical protein DCY07_03865 [Rhodospirillaceae bacterium]|nr:hypothetical protein [Rhodospirillaceae bacterium]